MSMALREQRLDFTPSGGRCSAVPCTLPADATTSAECSPSIRVLAGAVTVAAALLAAVGSGGTVRSAQTATPFGIAQDVQLAFVDLRRSAALTRVRGARSSSRAPRRDAAPAISTIERLDHVRTHLSLTVAQLAATLRVSRLAVYGWLEGAQPRNQSLQRLKQLCDIADAWAERSNVPIGSLVITPLPDGPRLFDLMREAAIDQSAIARALDLLRSAMGERPKRLATQALADGYERAPKGAMNEAIRRVVHRHGPNG
jgi:transcriptional regulator with XRE-family HTH domain